MNRRQTLIDTEGREWLHAMRFNRVHPSAHGWVIVAHDNCERAKDLVHLSDTSAVIHLGDDSLPAWAVRRVLSPDLCVAMPNQRENISEVWSISENRMLIPAVRWVIKYDEQSRLISLITRDNHLQLRSLDNEIAEDFGILPELGSNSIFVLPEGVLVSDNDAELMVAKDVYGKGVYKSLNVMTGKEYGEPYLAIGPVYEGIRYMVRPDGTECFVDDHNEFLFNLLPCEPRDLRFLVSVSRKPTWCSNLKYFCCNGKILADYRRSNGKIQSYLMDREGHVLLPPGKCPVTMYCLGENRYAVRKRNSIAIANERGELMSDFIYTTPTTFGMDRDDTFGIGFFSDNRCALTVKRKSGYYTGCIDVDGNEVIPFEFADIRHFTHGYAYAEPHMRGVDFWGGHREG